MLELDEDPYKWLTDLVTDTATGERLSKQLLQSGQELALFKGLWASGVFGLTAYSLEEALKVEVKLDTSLNVAGLALLKDCIEVTRDRYYRLAWSPRQRSLQLYGLHAVGRP